MAILGIRPAPTIEDIIGELERLQKRYNDLEKAYFVAIYELERLRQLRKPLCDE